MTAALMAPPSAPAAPAVEYVQRLWLPIVFESLNRLLAAARGSGRRYVEIKRKLQADVVTFARAARMRPFAIPYRVGYEWHLRDRHVDPPNLRAGAEKVILDALGPGRRGARGWPGAGVIHCDGAHCYRGLGDELWLFPDNPGYRAEGVLVTFTEAAL